jgi:hypothetical protein
MAHLLQYHYNHHSLLHYQEKGPLEQDRLWQKENWTTNQQANQGRSADSNLPQAAEMARRQVDLHQQWMVRGKGGQWQS